MQNLTKFANRATIWVIYELRFVCNTDLTGQHSNFRIFEDFMTLLKVHSLVRSVHFLILFLFFSVFCFVCKVPLKWYPISRLIWFLQCLYPPAYRLPHSFLCFFFFCRFLLPANFLSFFSHSFLPQKWVLCVHRSLVSYDRVLSVWHTWANCNVTMPKDLVI